MNLLQRRASGALIIVTLAAGGYLLGWSNFLSVKSITISESDPQISRELMSQLELPPSAIRVGTPIARVDKREITLRLRELIWVDQVAISRNLISGEVSISVEPRSAIGRFAESVNQSEPLIPGQIRFLGADLESFSIPQAAVDRAARSGRVDWRDLPTITLGSDSEELRGDIATVLTKIDQLGAQTRSVTAVVNERIASTIEFNGRKLDISWGNVKELDLKGEVLLRLLEMKENRRAVRFDLSAPLSPVVSNR